MKNIPHSTTGPGVYMIQNLATRELYVGSSKSIYYRIARHKSNLKKRIHWNRNLQEAWDKYGEEVFLIQVLERCSEEDLLQREQHYMDLLKPTLNLCKDAIKNSPDPESRKRISETLKKKYLNGQVKGYQQQHAWRKVYQYDIQLNFIEEHDCARHAANKIGMSKNSVLGVIDAVKLDGSYRTAGGFIWRSAPLKSGELLESLEVGDQQPS